MGGDFYVALTRSQVEHVAKLARLSLTETEAEAFTSQMGRILEHIENLNRLDTSNVPPTYHAVSLQNVVREDKPHLSLEREKVLAQAPDSDAGCFKVPKITEG